MKHIPLIFCLALAGFISGCNKAPMVESSSTNHSRNADVASTDSASSKQSQNEVAQNTDMTSDSIQADEQLGTRWGDEISSVTHSVDLSRVSDSPVGETQIRYANKKFDGRSVKSISLGAGQISFSIVDDNHQPLPLYRQGQSYYVAAQDGQSYQLSYENHSDQTYEVVASVDGLDVLTGGSASRSNSGYVLRPQESLDIEGFRKSADAVASFTFSKPEDSYAAHNNDGSINNTGIIGTVVYELKVPKNKPKTRRGGYAPEPTAFPAD